MQRFSGKCMHGRSLRVHSSIFRRTIFLQVPTLLARLGALHSEQEYTMKPILILPWLRPLGITAQLALATMTVFLLSTPPRLLYLITATTITWWRTRVFCTQTRNSTMVALLIPTLAAIAPTSSPSLPTLRAQWWRWGTSVPSRGRAGRFGPIAAKPTKTNLFRINVSLFLVC